MNRTGRVAMWLALISFLVSAQATWSESCRIQVRVTSFPPLYQQTDDGRWTGFSVDLAKTLLETAGCQAIFVSAPWKRALMMIEAGNIDMMLNLSKTREREAYIHFIGPLTTETVRILLKKEIRVHIRSLDDIKALPGQVALTRGFYMGEAFEEKFRTDPEFREKFSITHSNALNLKKLTHDRIIGIITFSYDGVTLIKHMKDGQNYRISPFVIHENPVFFGLSKKSLTQEQINRLETAYARAKAQGLFNQVRVRYQ